MMDPIILALLVGVVGFSFVKAILGERRRRRIDRMGRRLGLRRWSWETDDEYSDRCLAYALSLGGPRSRS